MPMDIVRASDMVLEGGFQFFLKNLPCVFVAAFQIGIDVVVGPSVEVYAIFPFNQSCGISYDCDIVLQRFP